MTGTCPHCLRDVQFLQLWASVLPGETLPVTGHILSCPSCGRANFLVTTNDPDGTLQRVGQWPLPGLRPADPAIPAPVADDWKEAHIALAAGAPKAASAMARRSVQGVLIDKGVKNGRLVDQLKEVAGAQALHPSLIDWADHIRILGNIGVHPGDDGLDTVTQAEAEEVVKFLDELVHWSYEMPAALEAARTKRGPSSPPVASQ